MVTEAGRQIARDVAAGRPANPDVRVTEAALTDSSTGTATDTIADVGGAFSQAGLNNIHASLAAKINTLLTNLRDRGVID